MRIDRKQFIIITALFLLLPLSVNYRLLIFGTKTTGVVTQIKREKANFHSTYPIIRFETENQQIDFIGPEDVKYPVGKELTIYYNPNEPQKFLLFNFAGLVFNNRMILPMVLLIFWVSFYLAVRDSQSKNPRESNLFRYKKAIEKFNK